MGGVWESDGVTLAAFSRKIELVAVVLETNDFIGLPVTRANEYPFVEIIHSIDVFFLAKPSVISMQLGTDQEVERNANLGFFQAPKKRVKFLMGIVMEGNTVRRIVK